MVDSDSLEISHLESRSRKILAEATKQRKVVRFADVRTNARITVG